jgi:parallel beta-helix repeat protein
MKKITTAMMLCLISATVFGQGSLTPPGAPTPSMKTLQEVEPRIPISTGGFTIDTSGSYYLTANLIPEGGESGININVNDVTLDLNGFSIFGGLATGQGIAMANRDNVVVKNGTVRECYYYGITANHSTRCRFENLRILNNGEEGSTNYFGIHAGENSTITGCIFMNNSSGIEAEAGSKITDNQIINNRSDGLRLMETGCYVANNIVKGNGDNYVFIAGNQLNILLCEVPESLDWPCSVKLAGSLVSTGHGVVITASNVTLDLMGFTLSGDRASSDYGVFIDGSTAGTLQNIVVRNGTLSTFGNGVYAESIKNNRFENLVITTNSLYGIYFYGGSSQCNNNTLANCTINDNSSYGIYFYGPSGQCNNNTFANCTINDNSNYGIYFYGDSGQCNNNTLANCMINDNKKDGVYLRGSHGRCNGNTFSSCTISGNNNYGINLGGGYNGQCNGNFIDSCTISDNEDYGILLFGYTGQCEGNIIINCMIRNNMDNGIYINQADGNRLEGNHITGQRGSSSYGIFSSAASKNMIFCNTCVGQTNNFALGSANVYGPIVTTAGELSTTGAESHPLANFSF